MLGMFTPKANSDIQVDRLMDDVGECYEVSSTHPLERVIQYVVDLPTTCLTDRITHGWPHDRRTRDYGAGKRCLGAGLPGPDVVVSPHGHSSVELTTRMVYLLERSVTLSTCWSPVCFPVVS